MLPQSLKSVLKNGIAVRVTSNKAANGIATVWITRTSAKKAHIKAGQGAAVRIGLGTVSSITNGTVTLRLHLSPAMAKKLAHLHHVAMTVRLALVGRRQSAPLGRRRRAVLAPRFYCATPGELPCGGSSGVASFCAWRPRIRPAGASRLRDLSGRELLATRRPVGGDR